MSSTETQPTGMAVKETYEHAPVLSLAGTIGPSWRGRYDWSHYGVLIYTNPSTSSHPSDSDPSALMSHSRRRNATHSLHHIVNKKL